MTSPGPAAELGEPRVLQSGGRDRELGNQLLLYEIAGRPALLKLYRRRRSAWREPVKRFSYRFLERKRGVTAPQRRELERSNLALWREQGFDVPALLAHPLPSRVAPGTALWMEYCPGPLLSQLLADPGRTLAARSEAVGRFAAGLAQRQRRASELGEQRLVMSHATVKHVLLCGERQVNFDLETSYAPQTPIVDALAEELAGYLRSVLRAAPSDRDSLGAAFARGYSDPGFLERIARHGLRGGGLRGRVKRVSDARRRPGHSEAEALRWLVERGGLGG